MSHTWSIACPETRQKLWIAQGWSTQRFYTDAETMGRLAEFLVATEGKALVYARDGTGSHDDFEEFKDPEPNE